MLSRYLASALFLPLLCVGCKAPVYQPKPLNGGQLASYLMQRRAVVMAPQVDGNVKESSLGSATPVHPAGYLLTAAHVLDGADRTRIRVMLDPKSGIPKRLLDARVVMYDREADVALLKTSVPLPHVFQWSPQNALLPAGLPVVHTGLATGHKSGLGTLTEPSDSKPGKFCHTLHLAPGDSGGALVSLGGEALGINHAVGRIQTFGASFFSGSYSVRPDLRRIERAIASDIKTHSKP